MAIKAFIKKHTWELAAILSGLALFFFGLWQVDLLSAPYIWNDRKVIEVLPFWYMLNTEAYVMFFSWIQIGVLLIGIGLWFWEDSE